MSEKPISRRSLIKMGALGTAAGLAGLGIPGSSKKENSAARFAFGSDAYAAPESGGTGGSKPNILMILLDNTGWGDFGCYGGGALRGAPSPRIDKLAGEGILLQNFNTEPQCTPSRSALMTGRHPVRSGTQSVPVGLPYYGLVPWEVTIAELLSDAGYATGTFGKWHLGKTPGRFPTDQGFDEWYGIPNSSGESIWATPELLESNSVIQDAKESLPKSEIPWIMQGSKGEIPEKVKLFDVEQRRVMDAELTRRTIDFMERNGKQGKPFFAYVPLTAMHFPTYPHPDFSGKSGNGDYTDMLVQTDHYVGQMMDALKDLGLEDDTIVIFAADNGPEHPDNGDGLMTGWTGPWAGTYFTALEGGLRAPCIISWPGKIPAGKVSNEIVHIVDIFSTLAHMSGVSIPTDRPIDGVDHTDFLLGKSEKSAREGFVIYVGDTMYGVKWRNWKVHLIWQETKYSPQEIFSTVPKVVNLITDPREERQAAEPYNSWVQYPAMRVLTKFQRSMKMSPSVPLGAPDSYIPSK
jgi:arylsulfatase A-like enzyme